eukprot:COSAG06_NODE_23_length_33072_cov_44.622327_24_plen_252_part_00
MIGAFTVTEQRALAAASCSCLEDVQKLRHQERADVEVLLASDVAAMVLDRIDVDKPETVAKLRAEEKAREAKKEQRCRLFARTLSAVVAIGVVLAVVHASTGCARDVAHGESVGIIARSCVCNDGYVDSGDGDQCSVCDGVVSADHSCVSAVGWWLGALSESCDTVCAAAGHACADGDWGVDDEASLEAALAAAGQSSSDRASLCAEGYRGTGTAEAPSIWPGNRWCNWPGGATTTCRGSASRSRRLCRCV